MSSSPDPLNDSPTFQSPTRQRRSSVSRQSLPPQMSSPTKRTFQLELGNTLSPQKLRVTVEAGSDTENAYSLYEDDAELSSPSRTSRTPQPFNRRREQITTTTVPLRGLSDSEGDHHSTTTPKRGRGRPRKSGTPIPTKHRQSLLTPTQKARRRRKSIGEQVYGDSEIDEDFKLGKDVDGKRSSARRRKSRPSDPFDNMSSPIKMAKGRRKTLQPEEVEVHEDSNDAAVGQEGSPVELSGALSTIDSNGGYSPSKHSTTRSTLNGSVDELDTPARFQPRSETPRNAGQPSPRRADSAHTSPAQQRSGYPSPSSLEKPSNGREEAADETAEVPEFDTILEGEEFSMISVDSVPSLQRHLSSPPEQAQLREGSRSTGGQNPLTSHGVEAAHASRPVSRDNFEEETSMLKPRNRSLMSVQNAEMEDSFSSIPSEILEAATPGRNLPKQTAPETQQDGEVYEDSFSAIPSVILDAATPAPLRQTLFKPGSVGKTGLAQERPRAPFIQASSALRRVHGTATARLLTPEETPSPDLSSSHISTASSKARNITSNRAATEPPPGNESYISTQMRSSPPMAPQLRMNTSGLRSELSFGETQTPSIVFSSPTLPPPIQATKENPFLAPQPEQSPKPLSPAARAGRMLQDLVVPSSPRGRSESLGSPFKSPVMGRKAASVANTTNTSSQGRMGPPPRPNMDRNAFRREFHDGQSSGSAHDDPFVNSAPSSSETRSYNQEVAEQHQLPDPRLSNVRSEGNSPQNDEDMSWQAEEVVLISYDNTSADQANSSAGSNAGLQSDATGTGATETSTWEERWEAERAAVSRETESSNANNIIVIDSEDDDQALEDGNDEDFGLLLETLNSSSPGPQTYQQPESGRLDKPSRSLSPRNINNKRSLYSDELSHLSSPMPARVSLTGNVVNDGINRDVEANPSASRTRTFNFQPRVRERNSQDVFALLAASPNKLPPVLSSRASENRSLPAESSPTRPSSIGASSTGQQQYLRPIPQKLHFTPRMRDPESSFGSSPVRQPTYGIFGAQLGKERLSASSAGQRPFRASSKETSTPPPQEVPVPAVQLSSPASISSAAPSSRFEAEQALATERTHEWTESVRLASAQMQGFASPTKSILRSPLKTPSGRPGSRQSASSAKTVAFVSSSPLPSSPAAETLSSTTWSRAHWILLDRILQNWKPGKQQVEEDQPRHRNSTRVISKLLGKKVYSGDNVMKLQQWHLEVVDEFRGCVPGWKEETIAMRLFSLIVGERDRALGLVDRESGED